MSPPPPPTLVADSDVLFAMVICSMFLQDVPMNFKEKVILCVLILKYMNLYIKTEQDLIWVNRQLDLMKPSTRPDDENQSWETI